MDEIDNLESDLNGLLEIFAQYCSEMNNKQVIVMVTGIIQFASRASGRPNDFIRLMMICLESSREEEAKRNKV